MGLFNSLIANATCPICETTIEREIQFKYGAVRQYRYRIGDRLRSNDGVAAVPGDVQVDGITACTVCQTQALASKIVVIAGTFADVTILPILEMKPAQRGGESGGRSKAKR